MAAKPCSPVDQPDSLRTFLVVAVHLNQERSAVMLTDAVLRCLVHLRVMRGLVVCSKGFLFQRGRFEWLI